jgi:hypothetical protein
MSITTPGHTDEQAQRHNRPGRHRAPKGTARDPPRAPGDPAIQQAQFGVYTPPYIISDISATQQALRPIKAWLRSHSVTVTDEPDDEAQIVMEAAAPHPPGDNTTQTINNQAPNQGAQGIFNAPVTFGSTRPDDEQHKR